MALLSGLDLTPHLWQATAFLVVASSAKGWWQRQTVGKPACLRLEKSNRYESKVAAE
ncbi:MAG TPA: hypothetical protein VGM54_06345 [Chthoniobacter sp.]|jgi:hypothetical protein